MDVKANLDYARTQIEFLDKLTDRMSADEITRDRGDDFQRDYTRIMYSSSFRKLQGKMQLLGLKDDRYFRNRLTHSLEVSQIARAIAERLGYKNTYVIEAISLAHDIGNPPFGHYGEGILHDIAKAYGGFEGNAQTLRVLRKIEKKNPSYAGLNLTIRSLLGVIKYYKKYDIESPKFIYDDDYDEITSYINSKNLNISFRTLDAQIMDLADEIAYAAHDLEDGISMRLFTVDDILYEYTKLIKGESDTGYSRFIEIVRQSKGLAQMSNTYDSSKEYSLILRKEILGNIVNCLINDIDFDYVSDEMRMLTGSTNIKELKFKDFGGMVEALKFVTFKCINRRDTVQLYEKQGEIILRSLYEVFMDEQFNKEGMLLPPEYRPKSGSKLEPRSVIDYLSGMMDSYALSAYKKYFGENSLEEIYSKFKYYKKI
ncbi:MAG: dNTP triphosphohydrolase [Proteocatella sp.]